MRLIVGHVIRIPDPRTDPPNRVKRHLCVCPTKRLFLRINTEPFWQPCHPLRAEDNPGILDWDSYVELRLLFRFGHQEVTRALARPDGVLGRMKASEAAEIAWAAKRSPVLSGEHQDLIWANLSDLK